mmetsp:Transcript_47746/g.91294  ORF Transcript_47746/g.91294 Transcript_47746/m.91294 type:complete len:210 (-) Transcript_47746:164-793(-)
MVRWPRCANAGGREPATSPRPPVLDQGATSELTKTMLKGSSVLGTSARAIHLAYISSASDAEAAGGFSVTTLPSVMCTPLMLPRMLDSPLDVLAVSSADCAGGAATTCSWAAVLPFTAAKRAASCSFSLRSFSIMDATSSSPASVATIPFSLLSNGVLDALHVHVACTPRSRNLREPIFIVRPAGLANERSLRIDAASLSSALLTIFAA